jgi:hypothetical protein
MTVKTNYTVYRAVYWAVLGTVRWAVDNALDSAVDFALNEDSHHPCLEDFLFDAEVEV